MNKKKKNLIASLSYSGFTLQQWQAVEKKITNHSFLFFCLLKNINVYKNNQRAITAESVADNNIKRCSLFWLLCMFVYMLLKFKQQNRLLKLWCNIL